MENSCLPVRKTAVAALGHAARQKMFYLSDPAALS
jgi:hypothetical protein